MPKGRREYDGWHESDLDHSYHAEAKTHKEKVHSVYGQFNKNQGIVVVSFCLIILIVGMVGWANDSHNGVFHSFTAPDPTNVIWADSMNTIVNGAHSLPNPWACTGGSSANTGLITASTGSPNSFTLNTPRNANIGLVCISPSGIDLSPANQKLLTIGMFAISISSPVQNFAFRPIWGFYLTTNQSLPLASSFRGCNSSPSVSFSPYCDPNIQLYIEYGASQSACAVTCTVSNTVKEFIKASNNQTQTLSQLDEGCGNTGGSQYNCITWSCSGLATACSGGASEEYQTSLNYTGLATNTASVSTLTAFYAGGGSSTSANQVVFPTLNLNQKMYFGIILFGATDLCGVGFDCFDIQYNAANIPPFNGISSNALSMEAFSYIPSPASVPPPDTGGFFGPLIRALISLGVWIFQSLITFFNYLYTFLSPLLAGLISILGAVLVAVFNAIGSIWGDGSFGNQISSFLGGIASYLANVFSGAVAWLAGAINFLNNSLTILTAFFNGANAFVGLWTSFLGGIGTLISGLNTFFGYLLFFYNAGVFGFNVIIIFSLILLAMAALVDYEQSMNPLALFIGLVMVFFTFYTMTISNTTINIIATNASILSNYQTAFNQTVFFVKLAPVLFILMLANYLADNDSTVRSFTHGSDGFMHNFTTTIHFYQMITLDIFKGGYWFFKEAHDIVSKAITALKGRWSPVEVAGTS